MRSQEGGNNRICHWSPGCSIFSINDYVFSKANIRKEGKMGIVIGILIIVVLVLVIIRLK